MLKYVEYTLKAGDKLIEHGACHKNHVVFLFSEGTVLTANLITDEAYAVLIDSWLGSSTEPAPTPAPAPQADPAP